MSEWTRYVGRWVGETSRGRERDSLTFMFSVNHRPTLRERKLLLLEASRSIIMIPKMASHTYFMDD